MGKKGMKKHIWPSERKWCVENTHKSRADESV